MPLDPSIPFRALSAPQAGGQGLASLGDLLAMQEQLQRMKMVEQKQKQEMEVQSILRQSGDDYDSAIEQLARRGYTDIALKLKNDLEIGRTNAFKALAAETDKTSAQIDIGLRLLQGVPDGDETQYQLASHLIAQMSPEVAQLLPQNYDKDRIAGLIDIGLTAKDHATKQREALKLVLDGDWNRGIGTWLSTAQTPEQYQQALAGAKQLGAPKAVLSQFDPQFSPEAVARAGALSMTPEERAILAGQAEARGITIRGQDIGAETQRRGQDISAAVQRRGQDISAATSRRGQDISAATAAAGGAGGARLSATAIEKIAGVDQSLGMLEDIERALPSMTGKIGPIEGRVTGARLATGVGIDQPLAEFAAQVTGLKNSAIKAITGAQMSEPEAKRIMSQIPDLKNPDDVFRARLTTTRRNLELLKRRTIELSGGSMPETGTTPGPGGSVRVTGRDGKTYEFPNQESANKFKAAGG